MLLTEHLKPRHYLKVKETESLLQFYEKGEEISLFEPGRWQVVRGVIQLSKINPRGDEIILGWVTANISDTEQSLQFHSHSWAPLLIA